MNEPSSANSSWGERARRRGVGARLALVGLLLAGWSATGLAADVQVACEPGLRVFLDGTLVGTSSAKEDGLAIAGVSEGRHVIRVEKDGFVPQSFEVEVAGLPVEVQVGAFEPAPQSRQRQEPASARIVQAGGELIVVSTPQNCDVEIDGTSRPKATPVLRIEGLAPGEHMVSFKRAGYETISRLVWTGQGSRMTIRGDFKAGKVEAVYEGKGALRVISWPTHCAVRFLGKTYDKTDLRLNVTYVPAGPHRLEVSYGGSVWSKYILIVGGQRAVVEVNLVGESDPFVVSYRPW